MNTLGQRVYLSTLEDGHICRFMQLSDDPELIETMGWRPFGADEQDRFLKTAQVLTLPYCGPNTGFEAANWLEAPEQVASMAMVPLRSAGPAGAFGLLVLASPDPTRYAADMGTDFLLRIGETAGAALSRLLLPH